MGLLERKEGEKKIEESRGENPDQEAPKWCCRDVVQGMLLSPTKSSNPEHPMDTPRIPWLPLAFTATLSTFCCLGHLVATPHQLLPWHNPSAHGVQGSTGKTQAASMVQQPGRSMR